MLTIKTNLSRPFKFDINSTEQQGRFRINDPKIFNRMWTRHDPIHKGISYIVGLKKEDNSFAVQSIRFNKNIWTEKKAATWWKANRKRFKKYKIKKISNKQLLKNPDDLIFETPLKHPYLSFTGSNNKDLEIAIDEFLKIIINNTNIPTKNLPLILLVKHDKKHEEKNIFTAGMYNDKRNAIIIVDSPITNKTCNNRITHFLYVLCHELGHWYFQTLLSSKCYLYFAEYVMKYFKWINLEKIQILINKYGIQGVIEQFPLLGLLLLSFQEKNLSNIVEKFGKHYFQFTRPSSSYMPRNEEIFCEMFAMYLLKNSVNYDKKLKYFEENYRIIENIITGKCKKE